MTYKDFSYLGWNPIEIRIGHSLYDIQQTKDISLDFKPGGIRNCSYAPGAKYIGVTAEDRTNGGQILAVYETGTSLTRVLVRQDYILYHSLNNEGTKVCYTMPSATGITADLHLLPLNGERPYALLKDVLAQDTIPAWFPGNTQIVYHTPEGSIEIIDIEDGKREVIETGREPCVSADGKQVVFKRGNDLFTWSRVGNLTEKIQMKTGLFNRVLTGGLSWSADGEYLSFGMAGGLLGKQTDFYILQITGGKYHRLDMRYLSGLVLL